MEGESKSKMSNTEWGLLAGAAFMVDGLQILIDWLTLGVSFISINPLIDIFMGMALPFYLHMRGENLVSGKRIGGFVLNFFLKLIPGVDELPLWGADVLFQWAMSRGGKILEELPGGKTISKLDK